MYTMHLDHQPMIQCSSDNGTVREIAGWYQDGREFVWLEAYDQFVQRQSSEREKGEDAEGNDPQPTTLPQPPPPTLPSDMAHVSSQTNGEGCHSQPKAKTVTYDWKATSTFEYDRNTSAGARSGASASVPLSPGLASVGSHPTGHTHSQTHRDEVGGMQNGQSNDMGSSTCSDNSWVHPPVPSWYPQDPVCGGVMESKTGLSVHASDDPVKVEYSSCATRDPASRSDASLNRTQLELSTMTRREVAARKAELMEQLQLLEAMDLSVTDLPSDDAPGWTVA